MEELKSVSSVDGSNLKVLFTPAFQPLSMLEKVREWREQAGDSVQDSRQSGRASQIRNDFVLLQRWVCAFSHLSGPYRTKDGCHL